jgi:hypothetical protein
MALAMDNRYEAYTLGKDLSVSQVEAIDDIARRHGFKLGGFRSFERAVTDEQIERIKRNARAAGPRPLSAGAVRGAAQARA